MYQNDPDGTPKAIAERIAQCADVYFGFSSDQLSSEMLSACTMGVLTLHKDMTLEDIGFAYRRATIDKVDFYGKGIPESVMMRPIQQWSNARRKIELKYTEFAQEQFKEDQGAQEFRKFQEQALCVYRESIKSHQMAVSKGVNSEGLRSWLGTVFQAKAICEEFIWDQMEREELKFCRSKAVARFKEMNAKAKAAIDSGNPLEQALQGFTNSKQHFHRVWADEILHRAIQLGIEPELQIEI